MSLEAQSEVENLACHANSDRNAHLGHFLLSEFRSKAERSETVCILCADTGLEVVHKNKEEREGGEACGCAEGGSE